MIKNQAIICLGASNSKIPIIHAIQRKKYKAVVIDKNSEALGFVYADEKIICSTHDACDVLIKLEQLQSKYHFIGLLCRTSGPALYTAAAIADRYHLRGINNQIAMLSTEKSKLNEFCNANIFLMPRNVKTAQILAQDNIQLHFPLIVKPDLPIVGKKAVSVIDEVSKLSSAIVQASLESGNKKVEIEEYIEGIDVSCMFTVINGDVDIIALWDELVGINYDGSINGLGVSVPSVIETSPIRQKIEKLVKNFGKHFPELNAILIMSFRVTAQGEVYIIELHADLGGDLIADTLLPKANPEFNFFDMIVDFSCGNYIHEQCKFKPTTLVYNSSMLLPEDYCQMINGNALIQTALLKNNFKLAKQVFPKLKVLPRHEQFLS